MTAAGLVALLLAAAPQTVDTIVVDNRNVFDHANDGPGFVARLANALHIRTRAAVIRRSLLVRSGEPYDSARVAESERALRALGVFRFVRVDTARLGAGGPLALRAVTADGWSSKPQSSASVARIEKSPVTRMSLTRWSSSAGKTRALSPPSVVRIENSLGLQSSSAASCFIGSFAPVAVAWRASRSVGKMRPEVVIVKRREVL